MRWITNLYIGQEPLMGNTIKGQKDEKLIIGEPKGTKIYTSEQLKNQGMFGVYAVPIEE